MINKEDLKETGERVLAGGAQGISEQGLPAILGTAFAMLGPKGLKSLAYGKPPTGTEDELYERISNLAGKLSDAYSEELGGKPTPKVDVYVAKNVSPGYIPETKKYRPKIKIPYNAPEETVAHEVGHAWPKGKAGETLRRLSVLAGSPKTRGLPAVIAAIGAIDKEDNGIASIIAKSAPYVGAAQLATILAEEGRANLRGAKLLELAKGKKLPILKKIRMFIPTTSYLGHAGTLIGLPLGIKKGIEAFRESKKRGQKIRPKELLNATPKQITAIPTYQEFKNKWENKLKDIQ